MTTIENNSILVAVSEYGEFGSLLPLAKELEKRHRLHPVFVFTAGYGLVHEHGRLVEIEGWSWVQLGTKNQSFNTLMDAASENGYFPITQNSPNRNRGSDVGQNVAVPAASRFDIFSLQFISTINRILKRLTKFRGKSSGSATSRIELRKQLKHAEQIFHKTQPRLVLSGQDYALSVTSFLSRVGEKYDVRTVIVPFSMPPTTKEIVETFAYHGYNRLNKMEKSLARQVIPHWLNEHRECVYSRVSPAAAIAADSLGLTPPKPWLPNSGRGIVCVPSRWAQDYYSKAGIPTSQLRLTGAPWSDRLVRSAKTRSARKDRLMLNINALASGKFKRRGGADKLAIISWPPNQYPRKAHGCATYEDLCNQFITAIQELENAGIARVAVSLHPTLTDAKLLSSLRMAKIFVLRSSLIEYVDCADVFVSTVSSTNFWALQCGIPTINFDGYLYGYTEFDEAGATTITTPFELFSVCRRLFEDETYHAEIRARIADKSPYFCETGGENLERIMTTLVNLLPSGK